ncbi:MAG: VOC family protein, partial [Woeseiaceae bacterium]|nr:VOC family protein [Woeseiaceae bacterium]
RLPDWNPNAGGIAAFYFRDPDDNHLEIIEFPADKGDPKWQKNDGRLFLGIDHTAIVVDDTEDSLRFWRDALGLSVAGASENYGPEQERLNNVFGARLRITALRADAGPGVEFLEYLSPPTGRPMPADTRANDLWHWQINISTSALDDIDSSLAGAGDATVSGGVTQADERRGTLVRDPDGHAALLYTDATRRVASINRSSNKSRHRVLRERNGATQ